MVFLENPIIEVGIDSAAITFRIDKKGVYDIVDALENIKPNEEYDLTISKRFGKRSLNANSYHWVLCEKMDKKLSTSKYEVHNQLMCDYGTDWLDENGDHVYVLMKDNGSYLRQETMHYRPTDATEDRKGTQYRWFVLLLPSHLMNTQQMSCLIDGTVADAKEMGIEVRTPDEIERMKQLWGTPVS